MRNDVTRLVGAFEDVPDYADSPTQLEPLPGFGEPVPPHLAPKAVHVLKHAIAAGELAAAFPEPFDHPQDEQFLDASSRSDWTSVHPDTASGRRDIAEVLRAVAANLIRDAELLESERLPAPETG